MESEESVSLEQAKNLKRKKCRISSDGSSGGMKKPDFSSIFAQQSLEQVNVNKERLKFEKEFRIKESELSEKRFKLEEEIESKKVQILASKARGEVMSSIIGQGIKDPEEIKAFLALLDF